MIYNDWNVLPEADNSLVNKLQLPRAKATILFHRGITSSNEADAFINPSSSNLHDPYLFQGMDNCVSRLLFAIKNKEKIGIFGDFDTDGLTGTAVLARGLANLGASVHPYIPHRTLEGHGISDESIDFFKKNEVSLLITVDCGVTSFNEINTAKKLGIETIVTDHHVPDDTLPDAVSIINPSLPTSAYPFNHLTGVGTAFKVIQALYEKCKSNIPDHLYALVALGTISDVGLMKDENRFLSNKGMNVINNQPIPSIDSLIKISGFSKSTLSTENLSYGIIPRINVAGRLDHANISLQLLLSDSLEETDKIASNLEVLNKQRQVMTERAILEAKSQLLKEEGSSTPNIIFAGKQQWMPGILGLIAGRLSEEYNRPVIAASGEGDYIRASARSIPEFNMIGALRTCSNIFEKYGGHHMAAGFTIKSKNLKTFRQQMTSVADELLENLERKVVLDIDTEIDLNWINRESLSFLSSLEPYGNGNPAPLFLTKGTSVLDSRSVGKDKNHLKLTIQQGSSIIEAMAFRQGSRLKEARGEIDIVYSPGINHWKGNDTIQLTIEDFKRSA